MTVVLRDQEGKRRPASDDSTRSCTHALVVVRLVSVCEANRQRFRRRDMKDRVRWRPAALGREARFAKEFAWDGEWRMWLLKRSKNARSTIDQIQQASVTHSPVDDVQEILL